MIRKCKNKAGVFKIAAVHQRLANLFVQAFFNGGGASQGWHPLLQYFESASPHNCVVYNIIEIET